MHRQTDRHNGWISEIVAAHTLTHVVHTHSHMSCTLTHPWDAVELRWARACMRACAYMRTYLFPFHSVKTQSSVCLTDVYERICFLFVHFYELVRQLSAHTHTNMQRSLAYPWAAVVTSVTLIRCRSSDYRTYKHTDMSYPKTPPHQDLPITSAWPRGRLPGQPPSTNQLCGPHRGFESGTNKRPRVSVIKTTLLKALLPSRGNNDQAFPTPNATRRCPCNGPGPPANPPQSGGQPTHLSHLVRTGVKKPTRRQDSQRTWKSFFFHTLVA
jgi:hypothetical protein